MAKIVELKQIIFIKKKRSLTLGYDSYWKTIYFSFKTSEKKNFTYCSFAGKLNTLTH